MVNRAALRIALIFPKGPLYRRRGGIFKQSLRYMPLTLPTLVPLFLWVVTPVTFAGGSPQNLSNGNPAGGKIIASPGHCGQTR